MSNTILKLSLIELRIVMKSSYVKILLVLASIFSFMLSNVKPEHLATYYAKSNDMIILLLIIITGANILGRDLVQQTYKYVFTGVYSKVEILLSKILAMIEFGAVIWIFELVLSIIFSVIHATGSKVFKIEGLFNYQLTNMLIYYVILSTLVGSFLILLTIISSNMMISIFGGVITFFVLNAAVHNVFHLIKSGIIQEPTWVYLIKLSPQGVLTYWNGQLQIKAVGILLIYIFINILISIIFINKSDYLDKISERKFK